MKSDLNAITAEPIWFFFLHSGAFVVLLATVFFVLGLLFGWLTWSRHKRRRMELTVECELMKNEIATLKRRVAEQATKIATGVLPPAGNEFPRQGPASSPASDPVIGSFLATASSIIIEGRSVTGVLKAPTIASPSDSQCAPSPSEVRTESAAWSPVENAEPEPEPDVLQKIAGNGDKPTADSQPSEDEMKLHEASSAGVGLAEASEVRLMSDPLLGLVYAARPSAMDDLTHLKGVASVLAGRLNELGVYTFKQIALWDDENIREFSIRLAFKDRIFRENWVDQAREMHFQKFGERI